MVAAVAVASGVDDEGIGSDTIRRQGDGLLNGSGGEPDQGFSYASVDRLRAVRDSDLDAGDPPFDC